jgi:predicted ribosome quality control (RQC) complex YloA/Tae2 family protein
MSFKLNNLKTRIDKGSRENEYYRNGNLLLANIQVLKKGMKMIELKDFETHNEYTINLDEKKTPEENINRYFEKAKDEKINFEKSKELYSNVSVNYDNLIKLKNDAENTNQFDRIKKIKEILRIKKPKSKQTNMESNLKLRHFLAEGKYHIFVGKDSKSNDLLSTKFVKQNDYWFHARGYAGSHVVLRIESKKEKIPKNIIKTAASIAGFYSKAKSSALAPVAYTFGKYVYKRKGMEIGTVRISKEKILLVKPEIPKNCEIVQD